jgi:hypothetical protein
MKKSLACLLFGGRFFCPERQEPVGKRKASDKGMRHNVLNPQL